MTENKQDNMATSDKLHCVSCDFGCNDLWKDVRCPIHSSDELRKHWKEAMACKRELPHMRGIRFMSGVFMQP
jgi:hypothetical protein